MVRSRGSWAMQLKATSSGNDDKENERDMDVFSFLFPGGSSDKD